MKNGKPKIEKGIPIPPVNVGQRPEVAALICSMKKGDSILFHKNRNQVTNLALRYIGRGKYTIRHEGAGVRVWKTA